MGIEKYSESKFVRIGSKVLIFFFLAIVVQFILVQAFIAIMTSGDDENEGHIPLPNNYEVYKISASNRYIDKAEVDPDTGEEGYQDVIDFDIDAIAWNDRYVFYHLMNKENTMHEHPGDKRFQILDTETGKIDAYQTLEEAKSRLKEIQAQSLTLKSVADFFPETKEGGPYPFQLE